MEGLDMADGGIGEVIAAIAAEEAATAAAATAAEATAASAAGAGAAGAAAYGTGAGGGVVGLGAGSDTFAAQVAAQKAAEYGAYSYTGAGASLPYGAGETVANGLLDASPQLYTPYGAGETVTNSLADPELSQFQKYVETGKEGFRNVGKMMNKMPAGVTGPLMQGLLGGPPSQPQPMMGGGHGSGTPPTPSNPYANQQMPQVRPFAMTMGSPDDEEMKRRRMLMMMQQQGMRG